MASQLKDVGDKRTTKLNDEMYEGFRNEEKARKLVQSDSAVIHEGESSETEHGKWKHRLQ